MRNFIIGRWPFLSVTKTPTIISASSEQRLYNAMNCVDIFNPRRGWRTTAKNTIGSLNVYASETINGVHINDCNYPEIQMFRGISALTIAEPCGPNILLRSHRPDVSPWTANNSTITPDADTGVSPNGPAAVRILAGSSSYVQQVVDLGVSAQNKTFRIGLWVKPVTGTPAFTIGVCPNGGGASFVTSNYTPTSGWQLINIVLTTNASATSNSVALRINNTNNGSAYMFGGCQLSPANFQGSNLLKVYETGANGLKILFDDYAERRKMFFAMSGVTGPYFKFSIPANQDTDDLQAFYETLNISMFDNPVLLFGGNQYPLQYTIQTPGRRTDLESLAPRLMSLGDNKINIAISSTFETRRQLLEFQKMIRQAYGTPILLCLNAPAGDGNELDPEMQYSYLTYITSIDRNLNFDHPNVFQSGVAFEEIT